MNTRVAFLLLTDDQTDILSQEAAAAGFSSVSDLIQAFVGDFLESSGTGDILARRWYENAFPTESKNFAAWLVRADATTEFYESLDSWLEDPDLEDARDFLEQARTEYTLETGSPMSFAEMVSEAERVRHFLMDVQRADL